MRICGYLSLGEEEPQICKLKKSEDEGVGGGGGEKSMRAKVERIVAVVSETENVQSRQ